MLIGIGHRSRHGKDTFARYLVKELLALGIQAKKMSWAYKGKLMCYELYKHYGLQPPEYYDTLIGQQDRNVPLPGIAKSPVEIWIDFMNAVRKHVDPGTWCNYLLAEAKAFDGVTVVADTRLPLELPHCDLRIKLVNPRIPNRTGKSIDDVLADYDGWNLVVYNDGTLLELAVKAQDLANDIAKRMT